MPTIFPSLRYKDAVRAIEFLEQAFGFKREMVVDGEGGTIAHAELSGLKEQDHGARDFEGNLWSFGTYRPQLGST